MADQSIHTETIEYQANGTTLRGYLAYDESSVTERPGVLVVHEWWGLDDHMRERASKLAGLGYAALAVDMYGDGRVADNPDDAGALMNGVIGDIPAAEARFRAALETLRGQAATDANHIAAIGYCFGGAMVLHAARIGLDLDAVVSFHGALGSFHKPEPGSVKARVLVCHGAADRLVPDDQVSAFKQEMDEAGADYRFIAYEGAMHGFTNPAATANGKKYGLPLAYDAAVDEKSWIDMKNVFQEVFG